jgi:hypothetical protein
MFADKELVKYIGQHVSTLCVLVCAAIGIVLFLSRAAAPIPMPDHVDVNGIIFRIQSAALNTNEEGYTMCSSRVIYVSFNQQTDRRRVLWHEITHAAVCLDASGDFTVKNMVLNSTSNEAHEGIELYAEIWAEIARRNPRLMQYFAQEAPTP